MSASYPDFSKEGNESLSSYVRMLYHTDQATKEFLEKLSKVDKKVTVVFYGDHLPGLYPQSAFKEDPESQYLTDYFVWSNYETPKLDYPRVNSSDFSALLLEQTNSKVSPYYALLTEVLHKVDGSDAQRPVRAHRPRRVEDVHLRPALDAQGRAQPADNLEPERAAEGRRRLQGGVEVQGRVSFPSRVYRLDVRRDCR